MAALTTLANIQAITKANAKIQALTGSDPEVVLLLDDVDAYVRASVYGSHTERAQRYLAAHLLSLAYMDQGGRGSLGGTSIGGISRSFGQPWQVDKSQYGATSYGRVFQDITNSCIPRFYVGIAGKRVSQG